MSSRKPIQTTIAQIVDYWSRRENECGLSVDWSEAHERCWRCGYKRKLQRCHIIADSLKGNDDPENLVLLCKRCHLDSPNVSDPRFIWLWLRAYAVPFYNTYDVERGFEEFERLFKRKPFSGYSSQTEIPLDKIEAAVAKYGREVCCHFGQRYNASTVAWMLAQMEKELALPVDQQKT